MFKMENALYSVAAHNVHSKVARQQYGSTFAMAFGELATKAMESDVDPTGLGCWAWIQFSGCDGLKMRVLCVYQPNHTSREDSKRVYAQHRQYFHRIHHHECPRKILIDDLRTLILKWKGDDIRVIIFMDANENMKNGHMQHMLTEEDIGLRPVTTSQHPDLPLTTTHKRGNQPGRVPVDEVWATDDLPLDKAGWLAFHKCPGDHRVPMMEIDSRVLLGSNLICITHPPA
jgi:hypothetical protein